MKKLLFLLSVLVSVMSFGQSVPGYTPVNDRYIHEGLMPRGFAVPSTGDTALRTGQSKRAGQLMLDTTGADTGFYIRINNRMRKIALSTDLEGIGGGGDSLGVQDTLLGAERYVNQDGNNFLYQSYGGTVKFGAEKPSFGTRYLFNSATVVDNTPSATATIDGSGIRLEGGGANLNNYVTLEDSIAGHNWILSGSFIANEKSSTSIGLAFAFNTHGNGQNFFTYFNLADSALSGYISAVLAESLPTGGEANTRGVYALKWSAGETFDFQIVRNGYKGYILLSNRTTNSSISLDIPELQGAVSDLRIYTLGGDWKIQNDLRLTYTDPVFPKFIFTGDSTDTGLTGDNAATTPYFIALDGVDGGFIDLSAASTRSADGLFLLKDIADFHGAYVFVGHMVNDRNGGVSTATYGANLRAIRDGIIAAGGIPIFVSGVPQNSGSIIPYKDTMEVVAFETSSLFIDATTALLGSGTSLNSLYDWGDGIHLNQLGNNVKGGAIRQALIDAGLLTYTSPVGVGTLPLNYRAPYEVGFNDGKLTKILAGTNPEYIRGYNTLSGAYRQRRNINLASGYGIWADFTAIGGTVQSSPYFSVNTSGQTNAASLSAGNATNQFQFGPSARYFYGTGGMQLLNGFFWQPAAQAFIIRQATPATSNVNLVVNTTTGNTIASNYRIAAMGINGDTAIIIGRDGNIEADSVHKYRADLTSLISANARNIPDVGWVRGEISDSLATFVGGSGMANPMTDEGDIIFSNDGSGTPDRLAIGSEGQVLTVTSGVPAWVNASSGFANPMTTAGDIITGGSGGAAQRVAAGTEGHVLKIVSGVPAWAAETGGGGSPGGSDTQVQYNNSGSFGGISGATTNGTALTLTSGRATTDFSPSSNDGASLGTSSLRWSDADFADGAVLRWNNSYTLTHSTGILTASGSIFSAGSVRLSGASSAFVVNPRNNPSAIAAQIYSDAGNLQINVNSSDRMVINTSGNVGIGQSAPTHKLDVNGEVRIRTLNASANRDSALFVDDGIVTALAVQSSEYTATLDNTTNVTSSTPVAYTYSRSRNIVTFAAWIEVTATGAGATILGISIPIASNFSSSFKAIATVTSVSEVATLVADTTNDRLSLSYTASGAGSDIFYITGQYVIE